MGGVAGLLIALASPTQAQVPERMHYQGYLTLANGAPVECADPANCDVPVELTFRIYADPVADVLLWEEDQLDVVVVGGVFNVILGETDPLIPEIFEGPAFLGVEVNGNEELQPRQEIVSAPFALHCAEAQNAQNLGGLEAKDFVTHAAANATELALQDQITSFEAKLAALEALVAQCGSSGCGGDSSPPLVNGVHTATECQNAGGIVTGISGSDSLCRFMASSCPAGWSQLGNWSTTSSTSFTGEVAPTIFFSVCTGKTPTSCAVSGHPFLDQGTSTCCGTNLEGQFTPPASVLCPETQVCVTTPIVEMGCF
jgi:hypothetical protein